MITRSRLLLALFFVAAGVLHFVFMPNYIAIMPPWLPAHRLLVVISGLCEIAGGVGVLWQGTRCWAGYGLIALCVAVLPANVQMLLIAWIWRATRRSPDVNAAS
jgi:uncharacterized membrane protein